MSFAKARRMRHDLQDYENQRYIATELDDGVFDALNNGDYGDYVGWLYHDGAMDAPNFIPAGSTVSLPGGYFDRSIVERGVSLAEQQEREDWIKQIMEELI